MPTANGTSKTPVALASGVFRQIGFLPLLAVFYGYTCGGPFGYEEIFKDSGPGMAIVFLALVPFFWSIPISLASAELNSIMPVQGGFYRWTRAAPPPATTDASSLDRSAIRRQRRRISPAAAKFYAMRPEKKLRHSLARVRASRNVTEIGDDAPPQKMNLAPA